MGIEPTSKAWEALVLPLNYARAEADDEDCSARGPGGQARLTCPSKWDKLRTDFF